MILAVEILLIWALVLDMLELIKDVVLIFVDSWLITWELDNDALVDIKFDIKELPAVILDISVLDAVKLVVVTFVLNRL